MHRGRKSLKRRHEAMQQFAELFVACMDGGEFPRARARAVAELTKRKAPTKKKARVTT